jgi:replicative DNA helicase
LKPAVEQAPPAVDRPFQAQTAPLFAPAEPLHTPTEALSALNIASKPHSLINYIKNIFSTDLLQYSNIGSRKTGFPNLDAESGMLYPGLYVLGAASSMGKTTFVHQLCDNLAERGEHVLYFSLIQSKFELTIKSICRLIARKSGGKNGITEPEIWMMKTPSQEVQAALDSYSAIIGDRISIFDNSEELNMDRIAEIVRSYIVDNNIHPVVIVDNIQHLQPKHTAHLSNNHLNLHSLKNLQQKEHLTIVAVSNIDTDSYFRHIDFDSFLNSGGIEYTADVIWGLQIQAARETEKAQTKIDARERFFSAKSLVPRKMELICLKNNFGKSVYTCYFDYYPQYNIFVEEKRIEVEKVVVERL